MGAGLPEALEAADEEALEAELATLDLAPVAPVLIEANSLDRELALAPVAVASTELRDDTSLAVFETMDDSLDEASLSTEDRADDRDEDAELSAVRDEETELKDDERELAADVNGVVDVWA